MTRCVIDSDGLFLAEQYFDDSRQSVEADVPLLKQYQAAKWDGSAWQIIDDYRGVVVYTSAGAVVWQSVGSLPDGISLTEPAMVDLSALRTAKIADLNAAAQVFINQHAGIDAVPEFEFASWTIQASEAKAWQADPSASTPVLNGIAAARGIAPELLKAAALRKTLAYEALTAHVAGQRQALQSKIEAAKSQAALDKIEIVFTLPEAV